MKIGVLVSGSGTNLQALIDAHTNGRLGNASLAVVVSNRPNAHALVRAKNAGISAVVVDHKNYSERKDFEDELVKALEAQQVELVVLAGFMRIVTTHFLTHFKNKVVNTHPALCPAFPGLHAAKQALDHGVKLTGCTVHFVDAGVDTGPIIAQASVPVFHDDNEEVLQRRIQEQEHRLLPDVVRAIADGAITVDGKRVRWKRGS